MMHGCSQIANREKPNIGVVTWPILEAGVISLRRLLNILYPLSNELYVISGGVACHVLVTGRPGVHLYLVEQKSTTDAFVRIINNILMQFKVSWGLARIAKHVDFCIFHLGGPVLLLPMLTTKLLRKDVLLVFPSSAVEETKILIGGLISRVVSLVTEIDCRLSSRIILKSENSISALYLDKYKDKISIAHEHFVDFDKFRMQTPLSNRGNLIGYIGRLSLEKGILNFVEAIPEVLEREGEAEILIGGDGQLHTKVEQYLSDQNLNSTKAKFVGWIPHDKLPEYLNDLKLLVLPSYTEGLPHIMLEAMACGTPVLATAVGAIPDVIRDGKTGFTMEDNSPECIARNVIRAFNHPNLEEITKTARALVEKEFTYEAAVKRYGSILASLR